MSQEHIITLKYYASNNRSSKYVNTDRIGRRNK